MKRTIFGFLIAPTASALLQGAVIGNLGAFLFGLWFSALFVVLLGAPAYFIFRKFGWLKLWQVLGCGSFLGIVVAVFVNLNFGFSGYSIRSVILGLGFFALHGALVAFLFWFIALYRVSSNNSPVPTPETTRHVS